ncbi:MAG: hypothetical protein ACRDSO_03240 [Pseudonocardiaceae bacterium]
MQLNLPNQTIIDRRRVYESFFIEIRVTDDDGTLLEVVRTEVGGDFGGLPGDPSPVIRRDSLEWGCGLLTGAAAARCILMGLYS